MSSRSLNLSGVHRSIQTTKKELIGWYLFDVANSVYFNTILAAFLPTFITEQAKIVAVQTMPPGDDQKVSLLGIGVNPVSYYNICLSISVFLQVIAFFTLGPIADYGALRKKMFVLTSTLGAFATACFIFVQGETYWLGGLLLIISNVCLGLSVIFYNSFLPLMVLASPQIDDETDTDKIVALGNKYSTIGFTLGYISGVVLLIINIVLFLIFPTECQPDCVGCPAEQDWLPLDFYNNTALNQNIDDNISSIYFPSNGSDLYCSPENCDYLWDPETCDSSYWANRVNLSMVGFWWFGFSLFTFCWLQPRSSPPLPEKEKYYTIGIKTLYRTLKEAKNIPNTFKFLISLWIFSDGIATVGYSASILGSQELKLGSAELGIAVLLSNVMSALGNVTYFKLHEKFPHTFTQKVVIWINIGFLCIVPIYVLVALTTAIEYFIIASIYGFQVGAIQSFSRVLLASMTPKGLEAEFFSLYELTDKGTSWFGPILVSIVLELTGSLRLSVLSILFFLITGAIILYFVNSAKGAEDARKHSVIKDSKREQVSEENIENIELSDDSSSSSSSETEAS